MSIDGRSYAAGDETYCLLWLSSPIIIKFAPLHLPNGVVHGSAPVKTLKITGDVN